MPTTIYSPDVLAPEELDHYLDRGWRPVGQRLYEADFIQLSPGHLCTLLPSRLVLTAHTWSKKQRKLLNTNKKHFRVTYGPAQLSPEKERVNASYAEVHGEKTVEDLSYHLDFEGRQLFNTWETQVFEGDKLVAFSFFDLGIDSAYSKAGVYDPAYAQYSLGLFTLLLEVAYCKSIGMRYFYPGYVSPDTPLFDYKHRIGPLELWDASRSIWRPEAAFPLEERYLLRRIKQQLSEVKDLLNAASWTTKSYTYIAFDARLSFDNYTFYLDTPALLPVYSPENVLLWVVCYNLALNCYEVKETVVAQEFSPPDSSDPEWPVFRFLLRNLSLVLRAHTAEQLVSDLKMAVIMDKKSR